MDTTTFFSLKSQTNVYEKENGIDVFIPSRWVVDGENRVSYTTIIRLVECCREFHWKKDIECINDQIDSICGTINCKFLKPIESNAVIKIRYYLIDISEKKYILEFKVIDSMKNVCCIIRMTLFFFDAIEQHSIKISENLFKNLWRKLNGITKSYSSSNR